MERIKSGFLKVAGYLVPLVQSLPPLGICTGLMTLPFASYLIMIFANLPLNLPKALSDFFVPFFNSRKSIYPHWFPYSRLLCSLSDYKKEERVSDFRPLSLSEASSVFGNDPPNSRSHKLELL
jgi:hypothetical protein